LMPMILDGFIDKAGICFSLISWILHLKVASLPARFST
jgi:hypothetical protein